MSQKAGEGVDHELGDLVVLRLAQINVGSAYPRVTRLELRFPGASSSCKQPSLGSLLTMRARFGDEEVQVHGLVETAFKDLEARGLKLWLLLDPGEAPASSGARSNHAYLIGALLGTNTGEVLGSVLSCESSSDGEGSGERPRPPSRRTPSAAARARSPA